MLRRWAGDDVPAETCSPICLVVGEVQLGQPQQPCCWGMCGWSELDSKFGEHPGSGSVAPVERLSRGGIQLHGDLVTWTATACPMQSRDHRVAGCLSSAPV